MTAREKRLAALLVEMYHLLLIGEVKFVGNLQGSIWTWPDRAKEEIFAASKPGEGAT